MRRQLRGLTAALILLAATTGLPIALAASVGDPVHHWASLRAGEASNADITAILATVFYLAWASFVVPVLVETTTLVLTRATHRPRHAIRVPLCGPQQNLARALLTAVLLLLPVTAATGALAATPPVSAATGGVAATAPSAPPAASSNAPGTPAHPAPRHPTTPAQRQARDHPGQRTDRTYRIPDTGGMRSYWALAAHYLGDGQRWPEIWHLNAGRLQDGTVMDTPHRLAPGWTILLPPSPATGADATPTPPPQVTVRAGDTLSGVAAAHGITDWRQVWAANTGRREPHGQTLTDPNLIRPGWTLTLPDSTHPPRTEPTPPTGPSRTRTRSHQPHDPRPVAGHTGPRPASQPPESPPPDQNVEPTKPAPSRPAPTSTQAPEPAHRSTNPLPVPLEVGLGALATLLALDRARRVAQRRRARGHRTPPPPPRLHQAETQLRHAARATSPTVTAVRLAAALTGPAPLVLAAVIAHHDRSVDLISATTPPGPAPAPFHDHGGSWRLPADAAGFDFALDDTDDPYPALTPIGHLPDGSVLVDLATTGPVSIAGDPDAVEAYLVTLARALVAAPWADRVQLHVPTTLATRIGPLDRVTGETTRSPGHTLPTPARRAMSGPAVPGDGEPAGWCTTPLRLYLGWTTDDDLDRLLTLTADTPHQVMTIVNGSHPSTAIWTLDGTTLTVPHLTLDHPITVDSTTTATTASRDAADLLTHTATAPDIPAGDPALPHLTDDAPPAPDPTPLQLNLLGPVELEGTGQPRRSQTLNLLAYLALHRRGADRDQIATALWPDQTVASKTTRNRITEARALVGGAITDGPRWQLTDAVTTDWQRFLALAAGTPADQHQALTLVRGRPFDGLDDTEWIDLEGFRTEVEASIVDLALTVAERDLTNGHHHAAYTAARAGLNASRYDERLHRIAIRAAHAEGATSTVLSLKREMRTALDLDIEPDDQIDTETVAVYADLRSEAR